MTVPRQEYVEGCVQYAMMWRTQATREQRRHYSKGELNTLMDHACEMILVLSGLVDND